MTQTGLPTLSDAPGSGRRPVAAGATRRWLWIAAVLLIALVGVYWLYGGGGRDGAAAATALSQGPQSVPVVGVPARQGELPVYLTGLGAVTAFNTVTVKSRVDGQLLRVAFTEGQVVHEGDLLAEIDPRPFEVQLKQAEGQMARDVAQLTDAQATLTRYHDLLNQQIIAKQDYDDKVAAAGQYAGAIKVDQALIDTAKLQLIYSRITAPISGRVGLRLVDAGNMVHATDDTGLVVIAQTQPIAVTFTMPEDDLPAILGKLGTGARLPVEAYDRAGTSQIARGVLLTIDNQIDRSTGTTRLKAEFPNDDGALFPNQFVNVRLLLDIRKEAVIVPLAAIQRGPQGTFVYAVKADHTVEVRPVTVGPTAASDAAIDTGVAVGDVVVVDGVDKLRAGSLVNVTAPGAGAAPAGAPRT
jgi:multidrug efflux system membrane fusion protein